MPAMMNNIDVLVLPSHNEGLPLVCAEAIRCGACAIGADVGGVAEVIGKDYVIPHGDGFVASMASKVVSVLENGCVQTVPDHLDWTVTAEREMSFIKGLSS
jgi:glycosyltransferase involved in cell wall biosynthesis